MLYGRGEAVLEGWNDDLGLLGEAVVLLLELVAIVVFLARLDGGEGAELDDELEGLESITFAS